MNKYEYMGNRFIAGSKYLSIIALISLPIYIVLAALNTGDLFFLTYLALMILVVTTVQSIVLKLAGIVLLKISEK